MITKEPRMRLDSILVCFILFALGCAQTDQIKSETSAVASDSLQLIPNKGLVLYQDEPFSGMSEKHYSNDTLAEVICYQSGIRHGVNRKYFTNGLIS